MDLFIDPPGDFHYLQDSVGKPENVSTKGIIEERGLIARQYCG
jgi:hypothetical protein